MKKQARKIGLILLALIGVLNGFAQKNLYKIELTIRESNEKTLYLVGNWGTDRVVADSAEAGKNGKFVFEGKQLLPSGIYALQNANGDDVMHLIMDKNRHFSVKTTAEEVNQRRKIKNSPENQQFFEFEKAARLNLLAPDQKVLDNFIDMSPNTLLAKYLEAFRTSPQKGGKTFDDERLLRTPGTCQKVTNYFKNELPEQIDTINHYIDNFLGEISDPKVKEYYLRSFLKIYRQENHFSDDVLVHLYDKYCAGSDFFDANELRILRNNVERKRRLLVGASVPPLAAYDLAKRLQNTQDIDNQYIILWLWDPDCDDCQELTPILHDFYRQYREQYDFEVFAVSVTDDFDRWQKFVEQHDLSWRNVSYAQGDPNYDFIDHFNIMQTPCIVLMSRDHKIISKQFPLEKLENLFTQKR